MSEPFLSEIKIVTFNFPPKGWALCNGQFLPINQNQALFALLGTTYGGNGQTTFALPNLRGRVPIHMGNGHTLGEAAGSTARHGQHPAAADAPTHVRQRPRTRTARQALPIGDVPGAAEQRLQRAGLSHDAESRDRSPASAAARRTTT